ncbi:MAG: hypothetical protein COA45_08175 [Zetaproteobacteria bacterium]|nr:MAG: hypothetical protein COA45_08175 [Zetaproteobacteria bacterium]
MIVELFYPSELKDVIEDLRANDDLNEEALRSLSSFVHKHILGYVFMAVSLFYLGEVNISILLFLLFPLFIYFDFRLHVKRKVMPFVTGNSASLKLVKRNSYRFGIVLFFEDKNGENIRTPKLPELSCGADFTMIGRSENCYINAIFPSRCMPCEKVILKKYCLKKSMIKELLRH